MSEEQDGPIVKTLPPELVYDHGDNVEPRWEAMSEGSYVTPTIGSTSATTVRPRRSTRVPYNEQGYLYNAVVAHSVVVGG
jgi:hypothetical protein